MELLFWLETMVGASADSLGGALVILAITTAVAVAGRVVTMASREIGAAVDRHRRRREILTDIAIYARTYDNNVKLVTSEAALESVRDAIRADPDGFRAYNAAINDSEVYEEYKEIRRRLSPADMSRLDTFFDRARLFEVYYLKMGSDAFAALPVDRKLKVVTQLQKLGGALSESHDTLFRDVPMLARLSDTITLDRLLPAPKPEKEQQQEPSPTSSARPAASPAGSDDGGQGSWIHRIPPRRNIVRTRHRFNRA